MKKLKTRLLAILTVLVVSAIIFIAIQLGAVYLWGQMAKRVRPPQDIVSNIKEYYDNKGKVPSNLKDVYGENLPLDIHYRTYAYRRIKLDDHYYCVVIERGQDEVVKIPNSEIKKMINNKQESGSYGDDEVVAIVKISKKSTIM